MQTDRVTIAIDGPAGAGKSTVAKAVAKALGILYLDTGAMYRAVALFALQNGVQPADASAVGALLDKIQLRIEAQPDGQHVYLNGVDVSQAIRTPEVSQGASDVGTIAAVRAKLVALQQEIARGQSVVMDGRDIGTHVLPEARFKFYMTADVRERARRRYREMLQKGEKADLAAVQKQMEARDYNDSHREFAPLRQAQDALLVDTTHMDLQQSVEYVVRRVREGRK